MAVKVEVWGDYALFTRPEMKVERVSYDVMTPSAARGLLEAIYWHPGMRWVIDRIYVLNEGRIVGEFGRGQADQEKIMSCIISSDSAAKELKQ